MAIKWDTSINFWQVQWNLACKYKYVHVHVCTNTYSSHPLGQVHPKLFQHPLAAGALASSVSYALTVSWWSYSCWPCNWEKNLKEKQEMVVCTHTHISINKHHELLKEIRFWTTLSVASTNLCKKPYIIRWWIGISTHHITHVQRIGIKLADSQHIHEHCRTHR